jgi:poly-gamma-glutamate synthesis protein (capsule biosynthesis protein)
MSQDCNTVSLFLCGDVMTGRGIDQALPHPGRPTLFEAYALDAREYVELAERANGPFQRPVGFKSLWGDALEELRGAGTDSRIINLETSITQSNDCWPGKGIHYRMSPLNIGGLTVAGINACSLANNHVLDWGYSGLEETLQTLDRVGIGSAGAGRDLKEAAAPVVMGLPGKGRVLLFSFGSLTSGVLPDWAATRSRAGVNLVEDLSEETAEVLAAQVREIKQANDLAIASIHWGGNWGYEIPDRQIVFAHRLIQEGFDLVHGHSSHHFKGIEVFNHRLILYGCGDFINDYEGIPGYEEFRGDLGLMYFVTVDLQGQLVAVRLAPMQRRQFRLHHASAADAAWTRNLLNHLGKRFGTGAGWTPEGKTNLVW